MHIPRELVRHGCESCESPEANVARRCRRDGDRKRARREWAESRTALGKDAVGSEHYQDITRRARENPRA